MVVVEINVFQMQKHSLSMEALFLSSFSPFLVMCWERNEVVCRSVLSVCRRSMNIGKFIQRPRRHTRLVDNRFLTNLKLIFFLSFP